MGTFGSGFLSSISDAVKQKSDQAAAEAQQKKHDEAAVHMAALQSGTLTPDQQKAAWDNWQKLYGHSKSLKDALPKIRQVVEKMSGHPDWGHPGAQQPGQPPPAAAPAGGVPPPPGQATAAPAPMPQSTSAAPAAIPPVMTGGVPPPPGATAAPSAAPSPTSALTSPPPATGDGKSVSPDANTPDASGSQTPDAAQPPIPFLATPDVPRGTPDATAATPSPAPVPAAKSSLGAIPPAPPTMPISQASVPATPLATTAGPVNTPASTSGVQPWELNAAYPNKDEVTRKAQDVAWREFQREHELEHNYKMEEARVAAEAKAYNPTGRPVSGPQLSVQNARTLQKNGGAPYQDQDGNDIDVNALPDNMGLKAFFQGNKRYYVPFSPNDKVVNLGGISYAVDPMNMAGVTTGQGTALGPQRAVTSSSNIAGVTVLGTDNQYHQLPGSRTQTLNTPGAFGAPPAAQGTPAAPIPSGTPVPETAVPKKSKFAPPGAQPVSAAHDVAHGDAKPSSAPIISAGRTLPAGSTPSGQVAQQQKRYTAINVAGQGLKQFATPQEDGISNLDIFKDPAAVSRIAKYLKLNNDQIEGQFDNAEKGGAEGIFSFYAGLPQAYAAASTDAVKNAYKELTPHDQRFVTDYYALLGQWGGMRAATGSSGSLWNFRNLAQEIPNPMSITSYPEARRKVHDNLQELGTVSNTNLRPTIYDESQILPSEKKKGGTGNIPPPPTAASASGVHKGQIPYTAPDGSTHWFKNQAGVDTFKKLLQQAGAGQ